MKIPKKKSRGWGQGGCEQRSEVFVKIKKIRGGGGGGGGGRVGGGQGGCERIIEVIVEMQEKKSCGWGGGGGSGRGSDGWGVSVDVIEELKLLWK